MLLAYCAFFRRSLVAAIILAAKQKTIREASSVAMIGPAMPKALDGGGKGSEGGEDEAGEGAEVSTALEALRGSFEEAEAFVDKVSRILFQHHDDTSTESRRVLGDGESHVIGARQVRMARDMVCAASCRYLLSGTILLETRPQARLH